MDKPKPTAPPSHRRYPRGTPRPAATAKAETVRRWPRAVPEQRTFPRV